MMPSPPRSTLCPYTTLFRSAERRRVHRPVERQRQLAGADQRGDRAGRLPPTDAEDRKSTRLNSSHRCISYAVFCLKKKKKKNNDNTVEAEAVHKVTHHIMFS